MGTYEEISGSDASDWHATPLGELAVSSADLADDPTPARHAAMRTIKYASHEPARQDTEVPHGNVARLNSQAGHDLGAAIDTTTSFESIVDTYQLPIRNFIHSIIRSDKELARDLTQEVFMEAYRALASGKEFVPNKFTAWLYRVAYNRSIDKLRRGRLIAWEQYPDETSYAAKHPAFHTNEDDHLANMVVDNIELRDVLNQLDPQNVACLVLHVVHGFSYSEIAGIIGSTEHGVRMRIARSKKQARQLLRERQQADE